MTSVETETAEVSLKSVRCANLVFHYDDPRFFKRISPEVIDSIFAAYYEAYFRFLNVVLGQESERLPLGAFPNSNIVLTQSRDVFRKFYSNPSRFDSLPAWVRGYVNVRRQRYVYFFPAEKDLLTPFGLDGSAHEFIHTFMPNILGLPAEYLASAWGTVIQEAFSVGLNQLRPVYWTARELSQPGANVPTVKSILQQGIFAHGDTRPPESNAVYQYCALYALSLGKMITTQLYQEVPTAPPLSSICRLTQRAFRDGIPTFNDALREYGVNTREAENTCRRQLRLPER